MYVYVCVHAWTLPPSSRWARQGEATGVHVNSGGARPTEDARSSHTIPLRLPTPRRARPHPVQATQCSCPEVRPGWRPETWDTKCNTPKLSPTTSEPDECLSNQSLTLHHLMNSNMGKFLLTSLTPLWVSTETIYCGAWHRLRSDDDS